MLDIVALSYNDLPPVVPVRGTIPDEGGTIGRDSDNTMTLPDPARLVSRKHGRLARENNQYQITNISNGNSFFVNEQEVVAGATLRLADGDLLQIGGYILRVRCSAEQKRQVTQPSLSTSKPELPGLGGDGLPVKPAAAIPAISPLGGFSGSSSALPGPFDDLLGTPVVPPKELLGTVEDNFTSPELPFKPIPDDFDPFSPIERKPDDYVTDPLASNGIGLGAVMPELTPFSVVDNDPDLPIGPLSDDHLLEDINRVALPGGEDTQDPLLLFKDESSSSLLGALNDNAAGIGAMSSMPLANDLGTAFRAPRYSPATGPGIPIPDPLAPAIPAIPDIDQPGRDPLFPELTAASASPSAGPSPAGSSSPIPVPAAAVVAPLTQSTVLPNAVPEGKMEVAPAVPTMDDSDLRMQLKQAFEEGLCAPLPAQTADFTPETLRLIGSLLRIAITGTLDLMRARSVVKKEIRVEMTVIEPNDNNPLKFSPDVDIAIQYLFGRKYPGFLGPTDAMSEAFSDLSLHQLAMVVGMRSAMEDIIHRFDPEKIQMDVASQGLLAKLSRAHGRAEYWDAYCARYQTIADALGDDFQDLYAKAFTRAYEAEIDSRSKVGRSS